MDTPETGMPPVTSTAAIDGALSRHWPKRLARSVRVSVETARFWIYKGMPDRRRREIAQAVLAECDRLEAVIADTRRRWGEVANEADRATAGDAVSRDGPPTRRVGRP